MTINESGAWELNHRSRIHRAPDFNHLMQWVKEYRVTSSDSFRKAGTEEWIPVMSRKEFASILNPDNQWAVSMHSGVFRVPVFEMLVKWAKEGRISDDAVVEGPRTPPGGVKASALPALAPHLKELPAEKPLIVFLNIDGKQFTAPDTATVREWIRDSRVPVDSTISLDGKTWEPVSMCGLFDLEDWPRAAHGRVEEEELPEMPEPSAVPVVKEEPPEEVPEIAVEPVPEEPDSESETEPEAESSGDAFYTVLTGESSINVESVSELKRLLKKRLIFTYDEIRHPSLSEESVSVGEYLEKMRKQGNRRLWWIFTLPVLAAVAAGLDLTGVLEIFPWF